MAATDFGGILSDLTNAASSAGSSAIASLGNASTVTVETQITPPITFQPGASGQPEQSGPGAVFPAWLNPMALLKPRFTVTLSNGQQLPPIAPWGQPSANYLPHLAAVGAGLVGVGLLAWGAKKAAKTAFYVAGAGLVGGFLYNRMGAAQ